MLMTVRNSYLDELQSEASFHHNLYDIYDPSKSDLNCSLDHSFCISENEDIISLELRTVKSDVKPDDLISEDPSAVSSCLQLSSNSDNVSAIVLHRTTDKEEEIVTYGNRLFQPYTDYDVEMADLEDNDATSLTAEHREKNLCTPIPSDDVVLNSEFYKENLCQSMSELDLLPKLTISNDFLSDKFAHEKSKRFEISNSMKRIEEKQRKAEELREKFLSDKKDKSRELNRKSDTVLLRKERLLMTKFNNENIQDRLNAAESKRQAELCKRISKARDEDIKGREIAFIQSMEAEQKQHSILIKHEESRTRLLELEDERRKRLEKKAEQEEAAKLRRIELEASKRAKSEKYFAKWKSISEKKANINLMARQAAQNKKSSRRGKVEHLEQIQKNQIEELKEKIRKKQEDSEKRHKNVLMGISRKALIMSISKEDLENSISSSFQGTIVNISDSLQNVQLYSPVEVFEDLNSTSIKWCKACNVMIDSDQGIDDHLRGPRHHASVRSVSQKNKNLFIDLNEFNSDKLVDARPDQKSPKCTAYHLRHSIIKEQLTNLSNKMKQNRQVYLNSLTEFDSKKTLDQKKSDLTKLMKDSMRYIQVPNETTTPWIDSRLNGYEKCLSSILRKTPNDSIDACKSVSREFITVLCTHLSAGIGLDEKFKLVRNQIVPMKNLIMTLNVIQKTIECQTDLIGYFLNNDLLRNLVYSLNIQFILPTLQHVRETGNRAIPLSFSNCCHHHFQNFHHLSSQSDSEFLELVENDLTIQLSKTLTFIFKRLKLLNSLHEDPVSIKSIQYLICFLVKSEFFDTISTYFDYISNHINLIDLAEKESYSLSKITSIQLTHCLSQLLASYLDLTLFITANSNCFRLSRKSNKKNRRTEKSLETSNSHDENSLVSLYDVVKQKNSDHHLVNLILGLAHDTELFGITGILYSIIFHRSIKQKTFTTSNPQKTLDYSDNFLLLDRIIINCLNIFNGLLKIDKIRIQTLIKDNLTSLQMRHILSHLIYYGSIETINSSRELFRFTMNQKKQSKTLDQARTIVPTGTKQVCLFPLQSQKRSSLCKSSMSDVEILKNIEIILLDDEKLENFFSGDTTIPHRSKMIIIRSFILMMTLEVTSYLTSLNPPLQINLGQIGHPPTLLQRIARLPTIYFENTLTTSIIYSSLICFCYENPSNTFVLSNELSPNLLANFIESCHLQIELDNSGNSLIDFFKEKFPNQLWNKAVEYFSNYEKPDIPPTYVQSE